MLKNACRAESPPRTRTYATPLGLVGSRTNRSTEMVKAPGDSFVSIVVSVGDTKDARRQNPRHRRSRRENRPARRRWIKRPLDQTKIRVGANRLLVRHRGHFTTVAVAWRRDHRVDIELLQEHARSCERLLDSPRRALVTREISSAAPGPPGTRRRSIMPSPRIIPEISAHVVAIQNRWRRRIGAHAAAKSHERVLRREVRRPLTRP